MSAAERGSGPTELQRAAGAAFALALLTLLVVAPALSLAPVGPHAERVIGDASTDAIRGLWGLDHVRRSLLPPDLVFWSREVGRPGGVVGLVLPQATGVLLAPLGLLLGPVAAWNLGVPMLLWATGLATAFLVRRLAGSWGAGVAAGGVVLAQPTLLHALCDGTVEMLTFWAVPATLACAIEALRGRGRAWGAAAGALALVVALDSPYYAVFTGLLGVVLLPWSLASGLRLAGYRAVLRSALPMLGLALLGAGLLLLLSRAFPLDQHVVGEGIDGVRARNSVDLAVWWHLDSGPQLPRDPSLAPTLIPTLSVAVGLGLALLGLPRSLPWLLAFVLCVVLGLGFDPDNPTWLQAWLGASGDRLGRGILDFNRAVYGLPGLSGVRFPFRWLTAGALCLAVGGGMGLARLGAWSGRRWVVWVLGLFLGVMAVTAGVDKARLYSRFPAHVLPRPAFAEHIAERPGGGFVMALPQLRPAPPSGRRADVEVFADLDVRLASADHQWFQVVHRRPTVEAPDLQTLGRRPPSDLQAEVMRYWDDAWRPRGGPGSAQGPDPRDVARRAEGRDELRRAGLRFLVVDLGIYDEAGVQVLREQLGEALLSETRFDEGKGVLVLELSGP